MKTTLVYRAILKTLAYGDIFDYPLTRRQLYQFLIADKSVSFSLFKKVLSRIKANDKRISTNNNMFCFFGREEIIEERKKRKRLSKGKLKIARRVAGWLKIIPWVKMIGVSGALAMENADKNDDIDLLIITAKNRLWLTRLLVVFLVELVARRRRPKDVYVADKICLNMFLDEDHLALPKKEWDLFTAHEVCQLKLLWEKDKCYQKFLKANLWVKKYLANILDIKKLRCEDIKGEKKNFLISQFLNFLEYLAYKIQIAYMSSRRTSEVVEPYRVRFHPKDCRWWVLEEYKKRLKELKLK